MLVGAHFANAPGVSGAGAVQIAFGSNVPDSSVELTLYGAQTDDHFGESVGGSGRTAGTGLRAFIAGAASADLGGNGSGAAWLVRLLDCSTDLDSDGRLTIDDLHAWFNAPRDLNRDGAATPTDSDCLEAVLRSNEAADMASGRQ